MSTSTVRITEGHRKILKELAKKTGRPMQLVLGDAIDEYRTRYFFDALDESFAALRKDRKAWEEEQAERVLWDKTLSGEQESEK